MKDFTKFVLCALGGAIVGLIYKLNKAKVNKNQIELDTLKNQRSVTVSLLKNSFLLTDDNQVSLFVEGEVAQNTEMLKSANSKYTGVYIQRSSYELEAVENNGRKSQQRRQTSKTINTTDSFILQSHLKTDENLLINNFSGTIVLPKVLKHQQTDQILNPPEIRTITREPQTDVEKAEFKEGKLKKFLTTISKIGVVIEEDILCEGTFICVYGNVVWDKVQNTFIINAPKYFGVSKEQIIEYFEADQYFLKFVGILLAIVGTTFSILALKYLHKTLSNNEDEKKAK
ncbi:unnamed protein product (macronuclear) [Paramecium tetraurelia]|uniref:RING-type E3 ubiquitin transferase n=1 Tax=Paramecium tetraurelia TaxID=5888 RepID=A0D248_PARTE|nr:uncharacterized protein GSPATT00012621001 [Paramecium tetraurelia]CAK77115.1 unnamed protein product [Paramecium tetraurelia]|eukprot:XP_001444512.1 hypothetical protein (macronuclear) [Paramecium tetraurelia strain d4-2]